METITEAFQIKTHIEQILLRPDTYIGSVEHETEITWTYDASINRILKRQVSFVPGLLKIFDEILVNASDHAQRDKTMRSIQVTLDQKSGLITIFNDGTGLPVRPHSEFKDIYIPELIFGHLLTSSNYDDSKEKTTGGRNGYGAKLTNIFSSLFVVETYDAERGLEYKQEWTKNMGIKGNPIIVKKKRKTSWTKVSFIPDFERFDGMTCLDDDITSLLHKRVVDMAGTSPHLNIYLNEKKLNINTFKGYVRLYFDPSTDFKCVTAKINDRWEIAVCPSDGTFNHVSFVNSISTLRGGSHVNYIANQITSNIRKNKKVTMNAAQVKAQLFLFVKALIVNPTFDSQSKVNLTTQRKHFGSTCTIPKKILASISKCGILSQVLAFSEKKDNHDSKKTDGRKKKTLLGIEKLEDANWAGGPKSSQCTLILTEGDSAMSLALSGITVVGRDKYGVFPLRGKPLNVRNHTIGKINANETIKNLKRIIGLQSNETYSDVSSLRYGHVMIMADQDHDGSHIKGLILNLFQSQWPSLFRYPSFLQEFITPIVKCRKGPRCLSFFTLPEYELWKTENEQGKGWHVKYYKGLATSTAKEGQEYFRNIDHHKIDFRYNGEEDDRDLELVFDSKKADMRKTWLGDFIPGTFLTQTDRKEISFTEFVNEELVLYSMSSNVRAIPSIMDGLKPGQRKIIHACFQKSITKEMKVAQLSGHVMSYAYHHGDQSLNETIVGLAQDFVGSNNINLLSPCGQFGTRHAGGKNHSSSRYIFTRLEPITRRLFHPDDDQILNYLTDDGLSIEPDWFAPIVPLVLVNGATGIGTGWATDIPNHDLLAIIRNIRNLINQEPMEKLKPHYHGFTGTITPDAKHENTFISQGVIREGKKKNTYFIEDLPVGGKWTNKYKLFLESLVIDNKIQSFTSMHSDNCVLFKISVNDTQNPAIQSNPHTFFKLISSIKTSNMVLFTAQGNLKKYKDVGQILEEFFSIRLPLYDRRKEFLLKRFKEKKNILTMKMNFILGVISNTIKIRQVKKIHIYEQLDSMEEFTKIDNSYDFLLSMPMWNVTLEKVEEFKKKVSELKQTIVILEAKTGKSMWLEDLEALEVEWNKKAQAWDSMISTERNIILGKNSAQNTKKKKNKKKKQNKQIRKRVRPETNKKHAKVSGPLKKRRIQ